MRFDTHVRRLGRIKTADALASAISTLPDEVWHEDETRQKKFAVHRQTQSLILLFCENTWPDIQVEMRPAWNLLQNYAVPVMREVIDTRYRRGGVILRALVAKLVAHGTIPRHTDAHVSFSCSHRIHVPLQTSADVNFVVGGKRVEMAEGYGYEINNQLMHQVHNAGEKDRLHFIFDYVPPGYIDAK